MAGCVVGVLYAFLQLEDYGACGVDYLDAALPCGLIGGGWLSVGSEEDFAS